MRRAIYAVIDTNVVVSALLKPESVPGRVLAHAMAGTLVPVLSAGIEEEYAEVLARRKFRFDPGLVARVLSALESSAVFRPPAGAPEELGRVPDPKDVEFYAVTLSAREEWDARLVTGNAKHFPQEPFVVTPPTITRIHASAMAARASAVASAPSRRPSSSRAMSPLASD